MYWYMQALKKYAVTQGRARRQEYWTFSLYNFLIIVGLVILEIVLGIASDSDQSVLANLYNLAVLCPSLAVGIRRMHDGGHSGWWLLVPIVNLIFALQDSQPGPNRYGPNPKENRV
jgi:uncharacterized membrane protein YhaH (DUF805 family)